jgi:plastocyanin
MRRASSFVTALYCAGALGVSVPATAADVTVTVGHNRIEPSQIQLQTGDTVVFHNVDEMPGGHTIAADDGSFSSPPLGTDEKWSQTFDAPGTHKIHIEQHPKAVGEITVE